MNAIKEIVERASALNGSIVLPEGQDARVVTAACALVDRRICTPVVLGTAEEIAAAEEKAGLSLSERGIADAVLRRSGKNDRTPTRARASNRSRCRRRKTDRPPKEIGRFGWFRGRKEGRRLERLGERRKRRRFGRFARLRERRGRRRFGRLGRLEEGRERRRFERFCRARRRERTRRFERDRPNKRRRRVALKRRRGGGKTKIVSLTAARWR
ncbi:MAG: hypothetical protein IJ991_05880 [Thermoguttaceae bacterium]|nr:hypothetical protein [Thermoguttaceae bacterium]